MQTQVLPRWVYLTLAAITAAIGLTASGITAQFFILGLAKLEPDQTARSVLVGTGLLMVATELASFGIASLLPVRLRAMRHRLIVAGALLLAFEAVTICVTQGALDQASEAAVNATTHRIKELQDSIQSRREAAMSLRLNGANQTNSKSAWARSLGAGTLRDALRVENEISPLSKELAQLQETLRPSTASVLGHRGTMVYGVARGLLISVMGLVMFGAAGALLREALADHSVASANHENSFVTTARVRSKAGTSVASRAHATVGGDVGLAALPRALGRGMEWCGRTFGIPMLLTPKPC